MSEQEKLNEQAGSAEDQEKFKEQMAQQFKLENILKSFVSVLAQKGWESMGMMENPYSGKTEESLANAKICIDTVDFIFNRISDRFEEKERSEIRASLTNLKMNYVSKVKSVKTDDSRQDS